VGNEDIDILCNKLCYEVWEPIVDPFRPAKLDSDVCALNVAEFTEPPLEVTLPL
jgi:hypothetical protein